MKSVILIVTILLIALNFSEPSPSYFYDWFDYGTSEEKINGTININITHGNVNIHLNNNTDALPTSQVTVVTQATDAGITQGSTSTVAPNQASTTTTPQSSTTTVAAEE
uniref:CSON004404 protein n=1 Tax=Culicoides sonorensis TaxID=179676 RepID=A0A336KB60_CULSO